MSDYEKRPDHDLTAEGRKELTCAACLLPIHVAETGLRYGGTHISHSASRCVQLLKLQNEQAIARIAELEHELQTLQSAHFAMAENCDAKDAALGEIYRLTGKTLDGDPAQYDSRIFVQAVSALQQQVAALRTLLERARDHMTGDGFAFDVKKEIRKFLEETK